MGPVSPGDGEGYQRCRYGQSASSINTVMSRSLWGITRMSRCSHSARTFHLQSSRRPCCFSQTETQPAGSVSSVTMSKPATSPPARERRLVGLERHGHPLGRHV